MSALLAAARLGDRIAHDAQTDDASAAVAVAVGEIVATSGAAAASAAFGAAAGASRSISTRDVRARSACGAIEAGSPDTFLAGAAAALTAAQTIDCHHHRDKPIRTGAVAVFVNDKRVARAGDETACGALIVDGALTVRIGGASEDASPADPRAQLGRGAALASVAIGVAASTAMSAAVWVEAVSSALVSG